MFGQILMILAGIFALVSAGAFSYTYLEQTTNQQSPAQVQEAPLVVKKEAIKSVAPTQVTPRKVVTKTNGSLVPKTAVAEKTVVSPGPLRATTQVPTSSALTMRGVIDLTNVARAENGNLPALIENTVLDLDAQMKLSDMFTKQYFEHVSPTGVGPADLAQAVGYAYVVVGENLALGDFGSDQGVVTAWMNSPGHRANILNPHYQEIGVAVGKGMYEGRETWLAVQSFGMPLSACPAINGLLKAQIDTNNLQITSLRAQLDAKKAQMDATPQSDPNYNTYVNEFNAIVPPYNGLVETNRSNVATYNVGVQAFNACIASTTSTSTTH